MGRAQLDGQRCARAAENERELAVVNRVNGR